MRLHPAALTLMTLMLAACGGGDDSPRKSGGGTTTTAPVAHDVVIVPALGMVQNATVTIRKLNGDLLFTGQTSAITGKANFTIPAGINAILIEVTGGPSATYFDEAVPNTPQPFYANDPDTGAPIVMKAMALVSSDKQQIAVTPLTDIAVGYARTTLQGSTTDLSEFAVVQGNDWVESFFNISNILTPPAIIDDISDFASLKIDSYTAKESASYALFLAALTQSASTRLGTSSIPMLKIMQELSKDLEDGTLNNAAAASYVHNNLPNALKAGLNRYQTVLTSNGVVLPDSVVNFMINSVFRVNNISNATNPETAPPVDGGGGGGSAATQTITYKVGPEDLEAKWKGTFAGTDTEGHACTLTVGTDGSISLYNGTALVSSELLNRGAEDARIRNFDATGVLANTYFIAKTSTEVSKFNAFGADSQGNIRSGMQVDESASKILYICQIPLP